MDFSSARNGLRIQDLFFRILCGEAVTFEKILQCFQMSTDVYAQRNRQRLANSSSNVKQHFFKHREVGIVFSL